MTNVDDSTTTEPEYDLALNNNQQNPLTSDHSVQVQQVNQTSTNGTSD